MQRIKHIFQTLHRLLVRFFVLLKNSTPGRKFLRAEAKLKARHRRLPRLRYLALAGLMLLSAIIPTAQFLLESHRYILDDATLKLVGKSNPHLAAKLTYDQLNSQWQFNKNAITTASTNPAENIPAALKAQVGGGGKTDESLYAINFPTNPKKGVTMYDAGTEVSFTMTPEFKVSGARATDDGRLVYSMAGGAQLIYTPKNNGMKEDIVLPKFIGKELTYSYTLDLPDTLTARIQPDGSVGIFSIDPSLLGTITTGTDTDAEKLKSAREHAEKNHLLFAIPAPVIVQSGNTPVKATAHFGLADNILTVTARDMDTVQYPASIDPSVVVTSSSDFATGWDDGSIHYDTDQISRAGISGGSIGSWSATSTGSYSARGFGGAVVYNGYLYNIGTTGADTPVNFAPINPSTGELGEWAPTTAAPNNRRYAGIAVFGGYLYLYGGYLGSTSATTSTVVSAPINSNGTLGSWTTVAQTMATAVCRSGNIQVGNVIYAVGGATAAVGNCANSSTGLLATVQYAQLQPNGTTSAWTTSANSITNARMDPALATHNNYIYAVTGTTNGVTTYNDVQYARVTASGDVAGWQTASNNFGGNYRGAAYAYRGYLYYSGGENSSTSVRYAPILANGDIGSIASTTTLPSARYSHGFVGSGDKLYFMAGLTTGLSYQNDTYIATIDPLGMATTNTSATAFGGAIDAGTGGAGFMYNGYLYYAGGYNGSAYSSQVRYASISSSGTVGTWATTSALQAPVAGGVGLGGQGYAIYGGRVYMIGGTSTVSGSPTSVNTIQYASFNANGTLSSWSFNPTNYIGAVASQPATAYNGYVYMIGVSGAGASNRVYRAPVNSNGTLGTWTWDGAGSNNLPSSVKDASMLAYGGYLYVVGGYNSPNFVDTVQYAAIASDGTLGTWATTTSLPTARGTLGVAVLNGYMYAIGGEIAGSAYSNAVDFAKINSNGTLGAWQSSANLGVTYANGGIATWNDRMYLISGRNNGTRVKNVHAITVNSGGGGNISSLQVDSTGTMATARSQNQTVAYNGYLYALGGNNGGGLNSVEYAPINSDGTVGNWQTTSSFTNGRRLFAAAVSNGYVYILGGINNSTYYKDIQYARINSDGSLGTWASAGANVSNGGAGACMVAYNGYIYSVGGWDGSNDHNSVRYAAINSNGTIDSWQNGPNFTGVRSNGGCVGYGGYLYVIGGEENTGKDDVQYATLNPSDGSVGSWSYTTSYNLGRANHAAFAYNGFMYIAGGIDSTTGGNTRGDIQYAPINPNGTLGQWQYTAALPGSYYADVVPYDGYVYMPGQEGSNATGYASLNSIARRGHYTRLIDLGINSMITGFGYGGTLPSGYSAIKYRVAGSNGVFGSTGSAATPGTPGHCGGAYGNARYVWLSVTLDDTDRAVSGDAAQANLTDITVNYSPVRPAPEQRLHGGKTLVDGVLSPLDTCNYE